MMHNINKNLMFSRKSSVNAMYAVSHYKFTEPKNTTRTNFVMFAIIKQY